MPSDLKLNKLTHDLEFTNGDVSLVQDVDYYVEKLKVKLLFFRGEWYADGDEGIPFIEEIYVKNPDLSIIDDLFKTQILDTEGIAEITEYESRFDAKTRILNLSFKCITFDGLPIIFNDELRVLQGR